MSIKYSRLVIIILLLCFFIGCNKKEEVNEKDKEDLGYTKGLEFTLLEDGTYEVTKYTGEDISVIVPQEYEGKKVTSIGKQAFRECEIEEIQLPNTINKFKQAAFFLCKNLKKINMPTDLEYIGEDTFMNCESLTSIVLPDKVMYLGEYAFFECKNLVSVEIPDNVSILINEGTFSECDALTTVKIGKGVESIGMSAFESCDLLKEIYIPKTVKKMDILVFEYDNCIVKCEAESQPSEWDELWNKDNKGEVLFGQTME